MPNVDKVTLFVEIMPAGIKKGLKTTSDQTIDSLLGKLRGKKLLAASGELQIYRRPDQLSLIEEELITADPNCSIGEAGIRDQVQDWAIKL